MDSTLTESEESVQITNSNIEFRLVLASYFKIYEFFLGQHLFKMKKIKREPSFQKRLKLHLNVCFSVHQKFILDSSVFI